MCSLTPSHFSLEGLLAVRRFVRSRHLYGSRSQRGGCPPLRPWYSYPGGSAWCVMFWSFCNWLDQQSETADLSTIVVRFFAVLAVWPWPLPWTAENMAAMVAGNQSFDSSALQVSIGRYLATTFVVPMPNGRDTHPQEAAARCESAASTRTWNMTQCVQSSDRGALPTLAPTVTQRTILREAYQAAHNPACLCQLIDYRAELRSPSSVPPVGNGRSEPMPNGHHHHHGSLSQRCARKKEPWSLRWPLYLTSSAFHTTPHGERCITGDVATRQHTGMAGHRWCAIDVRDREGSSSTPPAVAPTPIGRVWFPSATAVRGQPALHRPVMALRCVVTGLQQHPDTAVGSSRHRRTLYCPCGND